jgi:preprotein translocase subunit SecD
VVFFEKLKDSLRSGRRLKNSAQREFTAAWRTILVADTVSLIGATVLWWLTVGAVRGFAFFLGLSTLIDMVIAYFYTRPMVLLLARTRFLNSASVLGVKRVEADSAAGGV